MAEDDDDFRLSPWRALVLFLTIVAIAAVVAGAVYVGLHVLAKAL